MADIQNSESLELNQEIADFSPKIRDSVVITKPQNIDLFDEEMREDSSLASS